MFVVNCIFSQVINVFNLLCKVLFTLERKHVVREIIILNIARC